MPPLFTWTLAVGALCSLAAFAVHVGPTATDAGPVPQPSAAPAPPSVSAAPAVPSVTQMSPPAAIESAPAALALPPEDAAAGARSDEIETPAATPADSAEPAPAVAPGASPQPNLEVAMLDRINNARLEHGLPTLLRYDYLDAVALARADSLAAYDYFDHHAPDGSSAFSELANRGILYRLAGENLARNNHPEGRTVDAAFDALMASPGHRENILEPVFGAVGLAAVQADGMWLYVTIFTNPR